MTTNASGKRPANRQDEPVRVETTPTPTTNPSGVGGVAVYDQGPDRPAGSTGNPSMSTSPSRSTMDDSAPATSMSTGTVISWIIGIVVLILVIYFLWQMFL